VQRAWKSACLRKRRAQGLLCSDPSTPRLTGSMELKSFIRATVWTLAIGAVTMAKAGPALGITVDERATLPCIHGNAACDPAASPRGLLIFDDISHPSPHVDGDDGLLKALRDSSSLHGPEFGPDGGPWSPHVGPKSDRHDGSWSPHDRQEDVLQQTVPEPGSLALVSIALLALGGVGWREKRTTRPACPQPNRRNSPSGSPRADPGRA